jgi:hypothetical protein
MQTPWMLIAFMRDHLGKPIPSLSLMGAIGNRFVNDVRNFSRRYAIPIVRFNKGQRKDSIAAKHRARYHSSHGVVFIGVAQENAWSFKTTGRHNHITRATAFVNHYYFYVEDREWGPAFIKVCSYAPYPGKLCLNGHEWAKRQLVREGIQFESLDNGFRSCEDPDRLQTICDSLGPDDVEAFFLRWLDVLPWPLDRAARVAGHGHALSIRQIEVSLTQVFERPVQGRYFFEQIIRDNLDLGRPDRVSLLYPGRHTRRTRAPKHGYRTRVIIDGVLPTLHVEYKSSHVKQYHKENRALRTETTINNPNDFGINKGVAKNMRPLRKLAESVNNSVLETERVSENCALSTEELERLQRPTVEHGQRASALRFGDRRVMALLQALCLLLLLPAGFRNRDIRPYVAQLLGVALDAYSQGRMTYDLRRLRLKGLIRRVAGSHTYVVTRIGLRVAYFHTKLYARILRPGWAAIALKPDGVPRRLRQAFARVDAEIARLCDAAALGPPPSVPPR